MSAPLLLLLALAQPAPAAGPNAAPAAGPNAAPAAGPDAAASPPAAPASAPAALAPGGTGQDVRAQATFIFELAEQGLKVQESWAFENTSGRQIGAEHLTFRLPEQARRLSVDGNSLPFVAAEDGSSIRATEPLGEGKRSLTAGYFVDLDGTQATLRRGVPVSLMNARVIIESAPGLSVGVSVPHQTRESDLNGIRFTVVEFGAVRAGDDLTLTFTGLPSRSTWPRTLAVLVALAVVGWMVLALSRRDRVSSPTALGPLAPAARRERILRALELLEAEQKAGKVKEKAYQRRRAELLFELAAALGEQELAEQAAAEARTRAARES